MFVCDVRVGKTVVGDGVSRDVVVRFGSSVVGAGHAGGWLDGVMGMCW